MKKIFFLSLFVSASINLKAEWTVSGNIREADTEMTLPGVSIYIEDLKTGTITDLNGNYLIENIKSGDFYLEISYTGFQTISRIISVRSDTVINFSLESAVTELSETVVTGVMRSSERMTNSTPIKAFGKKFFRESTASNLIDALKNIPGISQITTGTSVSKPIIRGLGYNRILTLQNGIRIEGQQWGDEHGIEIDEYAVERAEIIKGPGSLVYGSDGIAGVLNFLSPRPLPDGHIRTNLTTAYQSNQHLIGHSISNQGNKNNFLWMTQFSHKLAGSYKNKLDGKVFNTGFQEWNGKLFLGVNKQWGYTHLTASSFNTKLGITEGERDSLGNLISDSPDKLRVYFTDFPHQKINHFNLTSNSYFILNRGAIKSDIGYQQNFRREYEDAANPSEPEMFLKLNTFSYNLRYNFDRKNDWEVTLGVSGMQQTNHNKGEEFLIPDYRLFDFGFFGFIKKTFNKITFDGGIRMDNRFLRAHSLFLDENNLPVPESELNVTQKFTSIKRYFKGVSGSLGISYQPAKSSVLKINLSKGYRAPNISELASNGIHEGTFRHESGRADLKPENSTQLDLGYYLNSEHVTLEFTPFANLISNYIYLQKKPSTVGHYEPGQVISEFEYTAGLAVLYGGEIYLDFHPHPLDWLHVAQSLSIVRGVQPGQADSIRNLPFIPAHKYHFEIKALRQTPKKVFSEYYFKFFVDHYFRQNKIFEAYETESRAPSYTLLGLGIGTDIKAFNRKDFLSIVFSGENLADIIYQSHLSRLKYAPENPVTGKMGIYNMGRNFSLKLIVTI